MSAFGLLWANLHRRPVRTYLTLLSVLVAFLLFTLLRTIAVWFEGAGYDAASNRLVVTAKYSIIDLLPIRHADAIRAVDGVEAVTHQTWFGGNYQDPRNFFPKYPVEPRAWFDMNPEFVIDPEHVEAFESIRTGAVVPVSLMERYGWKIGDIIPIEADIYPMRDGNRLWQFDLVGSYTMDSDMEPSLFLFHYDYFDKARSHSTGTVGWFTVRIADPEQAAEVASAIDGLFENSLNPVKTATEDEFGRAFAAQLGNVGLMATGILGAVFFTILLLTANTMAQALRERVPELAVLKTLGFSDAWVAMLVLGESVLLCVLGGLLGIGLTVLLAPAIDAVIASTGFGAFVLYWPAVGAGVGVAVLLGLLVGWPPARLANRLTIADALRRS